MKTKSNSVSLTTLFSFIFFFSGFASLIYQVVWQRLLTIYYGVGTVSITLIVSVYMFGLGLGSLGGGFLAERVKDKIRMYFIIEFLMGCFGLISLPFITFLGKYTAGSNYFISFLCMFFYLSIPTLLMGITLPLLTKIYNQIKGDFLESISRLYFINTLGAAAGSIFASYFLISWWGLDVGLYCAVAINFILAGIIYQTRTFSSHQSLKTVAAVRARSSLESWGNIVFLLVFITGFLAIGYEIVWFRVIGVLVKASPYAFSSILAVYLLGIALGSLSITKYIRKRVNIDQRDLFFRIQVAIGLCITVIFVSYYYLTLYTPFRFFTEASFSYDLHPSFYPSCKFPFQHLGGYIYSWLDVFGWSFFFLFLPTFLMGTSFPLVSSLALGKKEKEGQVVGQVYFFNILGNVFGGFLTGFLLLPHLGTEQTILLFSLIGMGFGVFVQHFKGKKISFSRKFVFIICFCVLTIIIFPKKGQLYYAMHPKEKGQVNYYFEEGLDGTIVTYENGEKIENYINGSAHGGRPIHIFFYEAIEAMSFSQGVQDILVIGYGTGSIPEAALKSDEVVSLDLIELNEGLMKNLKKIPLFQDMLDDERINLIFDDGRRYLLREEKKYDLVLIDPLRTTTAYSNNLYSAEFFELVKGHLKPGGVFMVWMDEFYVMPRTIESVFDYVRVYNGFALAAQLPMVDHDERRQNLLQNFSEEERPKIAAAGKYVGDQMLIKNKVGHYPINQDLKPHCEYYIGLKAKKKWKYKRISE